MQLELVPMSPLLYIYPTDPLFALASKLGMLQGFKILTDPALGIEALVLYERKAQTRQVERKRISTSLLLYDQL